MPFRIAFDKVPAPKFRKNLAGLHDRFQAAFSASMNMAASLIKQRGDADIKAAGQFGQRWTAGLHVVVQSGLRNMQISMYHDISYAGIFETGGVIKGHPMLWLPLSFSNAKGVPAKDFGGGLFSVNRRAGGPPLLFSIADKMPKYFGVEQVTIPQKFHLRDIQKSVMANFRQMFDSAFKAA